ncbi:MAG: queuine tRNA-ribosyltransferase [Parcubacteria group bacterium Gr01-1014_31]|nr:MAG: queuine tRNA-ribosyltransferase [Parcubacteria group bacterium Gr01-1014_31]
MPIATRGAVKHLTAAEVGEMGADAVLANTYHLSQRPGEAIVAAAGGLHKMMGWRKPILTDSGGFQVFSLARYRQITDRGVRFRDPLSGAVSMLSPRRAISIQRKLGADIIMVLDECVGYGATRQQVAAAVDRTTRWARQSVRYRPIGQRRPLMFGIVQGGVYPELRRRSAAELTALPFDGFAIGGLAVGEQRSQMLSTLRNVLPLLPESLPRYLMGVGRPEEIVAAVRLGVDMFDCVIPTREARHGRLYVWSGGVPTFRAKGFYRTVAIKNAGNRRRFAPPDRRCSCLLCRRYTLAYLHHLYKVGEPLGARLATLHNLRFYLDLMERLRRAIRTGAL